MSMQRKRYSAELKARIALEAIKGQKNANEIAAEYGVHPTQIAVEKAGADGLPEVFFPQAGKREKNEEASSPASTSRLISLFYQVRDKPSASYPNYQSRY